MLSGGKSPEGDATAGKEAAAEDDLTTAQWVALAMLAIGQLVLIGQGFWWLIYRVWPPLPVSRLFEWVGLPVPSFGSGKWGEKLDMVLGAPISLVLFVLGFIVVLTVMDREKEEAEAEETAKRPRLVKLMKLRKKSKPPAAH